MTMTGQQASRAVVWAGRQAGRHVGMLTREHVGMQRATVGKSKVGRNSKKFQ